ncbi:MULTISPECIES: hypothetical protein [unclassified Caballeronia]|uniref:hypothetical protein n=1 Tax=unclassified Caballeronia TaxID=2646786 RepID=UPI0028637BF4|nr:MULTISPECIES: hypothetical protein [unclassified Caballeronia]MDR5738918.1 hypothetical protein [Caballeronia sp. LZ016]MDR5807406.1 hypothetical protein [Caballeronia sp. LZ019]
MVSKQPTADSANQTMIPDNKINWIKNRLVATISFIDGTVRSDSVKVRINVMITNPTDDDIRATWMPTPDDYPIRLYCNGKQINPFPAEPVDRPLSTVMPPSDEQLLANRYVIKAKEHMKSPIPLGLAIENSRLLTGTHTYEIVYWQTQLDWIDVRDVLERTDAQGRGRMRYPITDNAPSNRLYFKVYKPTEEDAARGRKIEFLGEVDAKTQVPPPPRARPGDFAPQTGYWSAVGDSIRAIGGYHEVFVKGGDSMPNLPGNLGVDPFSFEWQYVGDASAKQGESGQ